jgi:hypothetical protein
MWAATFGDVGSDDGAMSATMSAAMLGDVVARRLGCVSSGRLNLERPDCDVLSSF